MPFVMFSDGKPHVTTQSNMKIDYHYIKLYQTSRAANIATTILQLPNMHMMEYQSLHEFISTGIGNSMITVAPIDAIDMSPEWRYILVNDLNDHQVLFYDNDKLQVFTNIGDAVVALGKYIKTNGVIATIMRFRV